MTALVQELNGNTEFGAFLMAERLDLLVWAAREELGQVEG